MNDDKNEKRIAHLGFIQDVITRMAGNLFYLRGWMITLMAGILVLLAKFDGGKFPIILLGGITMIFWGYDGYFLSLEIKYRKLYDEVRKMKEDEIDFSMDVGKFKDHYSASILSCVLSPTLRYFYGPLLSAILYVIFFIK